jgi:hypothetical protein
MCCHSSFQTRSSGFRSSAAAEWQSESAVGAADSQEMGEEVAPFFVYPLRQEQYIPENQGSAQDSPFMVSLTNCLTEVPIDLLTPLLP